MTKRKIPEFEPHLLRPEEPNRDLQNRRLLVWLGDDDRRAELFKWINEKNNGALVIHSRDSAPRQCDCQGVDVPLKEPVVGHKEVLLITDRARIIPALEDNGTAYSNRIYAELGGGSFMLALDPKRALAHKAQRDAYKSCFPHKHDELIGLAHQACKAASITALRTSDFDLAIFAEQSALRFCQKLMGYAMSDYPLLEKTLRDAYQALVYQVLGRHFVTDPTLIPNGKASMARLLKRTSALIDAYEAKDEDVLKGCEDRAVPAGFIPVMKMLGRYPGGDFNGEQRAIVAMGAAIGTVGNVQAAACIAVKGLFKAKNERSQTPGPDIDSLWAQARKLAKSERLGDPTAKLGAWKTLIQDLLRQNPPIPFLPRLSVDEEGKSQGEVILALGGGTQSGEAGKDDPLIWGLPTDGKHWCAGQELAWPLIVEIVRQVMGLPGLEEQLDAEDASVIGLKKRWGFACESYPLTHRRDRRVAQSSLNVAMRLKAPIRDNADRVREVIRVGAPRIEEALRESRHVHFAWFELIESDSVLLLHTVYDGPFDAYLQHFALKVGVLFDALFECVEDPPPLPVDKFPTEFVAHLKRYNRAPAMGYFFSAYPSREVADILRDQWAQP